MISGLMMKVSELERKEARNSGKSKQSEKVLQEVTNFNSLNNTCKGELSTIKYKKMASLISQQPFRI
jgi:hypothetical protein